MKTRLQLVLQAALVAGMGFYVLTTSPTAISAQSAATCGFVIHNECPLDLGQYDGWCRSQCGDWTYAGGCGWSGSGSQNYIHCYFPQ